MVHLKFENAELCVCPNPSNGRVTIEATDKVIRVDVHDNAGRIVVTFEATNVLDLGGPPLGT